MKLIHFLLLLPLLPPLLLLLLLRLFKKIGLVVQVFLGRTREDELKTSDLFL